MTCLLSIVIPTRNKATFAISAIRSILNMASDRFELIIQDNSDNDELEDYVKKHFIDVRLHYNHTKERLDVPANFNKALEFATGEYFTIIGDDDGVNPEILDAVLWAKENNIDALTTNLIVEYFWPDMIQKIDGAELAGNLKISFFSGEITFPDHEKGMQRCAKEAFQNLVYSIELPKIYYGIVKKDCIEKVREKTGTYLPGVSPDMCGAMAVASYVTRMAAIDYPLFVPGCCSSSGGGLSVQKKHHGRLEDQLHLPVDCCEKWPEIVPKFFAVQTVWAQSGWNALKATGREDVLRKFNVPLLHAMCMVFNPQYFAFTMRSFFRIIKSSNSSFIIGAMHLLYYYVVTWALRVLSLLKRMLSRFKPPNTYNIYGINNIEDAVNSLNVYLAENGKQFKFYTQNMAEKP